MRKRKRNKLDNSGFGFLVGMLVPIAAFFMVWLIKQPEVSFVDYIKNMWNLSALVKLGSLCVFVNVGAFWIFIQAKYERAARGVIGATLLYAFIILFSKAV